MVGLDTLAHVIGTMDKNLADDPWHRWQPEWLAALISKGALGQKSGAGVYRKAGREIQVLDLKAQDYRPSAGKLADEVGAILQERDPAKRFAALRASSHPQAQFLWSLFRDIFHYSAAQLANVADNARDLDLAMRWGFGWAQGPFETWQAAGWQQIAQAVAEDIAAGRAMSDSPRLAAGARPPGRARARGFVFGAQRQAACALGLPVYRRQIYPERVFGEAPDNRGVTVWERRRAPLEPARRGSGRGHPVGISKNHTLGAEVLEGILQAVARAEREFDGHLASGSLRRGRQPQCSRWSKPRAAGQWDMLEATVEKFQRASQALQVRADPHRRRRAGHGARRRLRFLMHASHRVLALESYIGLVEAGVGLIPAGGGSKEFAGRAAALAAKTATPGEVFPFLQPIFQTIATAQVAKSAREAIETGFAREQDIVLFHPDELLFVAIGQARAAAQVPATCRRPAAERAGRRPQWHRQLRDDAGQHARRRHDQRARLPRGAQRRRGAVRRRDRDRHARGRGMAADRGAQGVRGAAAHAGDPGPHPPHWKPASLCGIDGVHPEALWRFPLSAGRTGGAGSARPRSWGAVVG